jgi:acetyl esterase
MWLTAMEAIGWPKASESAVAQARRDLRLLLQTTSIWRPVARVQEARASGPKGEIPLRIYTPILKRREGPLLVWFHGGGFVVGDLETADPTCRSLAEKSGATVISVDYRLSPEHAFDDGVNDAYAATLWAFNHARALGCDPSRVAIGGDSAGGTFAALVAQRLREANGPRPALQVLVYPCTDCSQSLANRDPDIAKFLTWETVEWFAAHSFAGRDLKHPSVSPYYCNDLSGLPPTVLVTAECDLLCTDGEAYAARLRAAGVTVRQQRYEGQIHGFFMMDLVFPAARRAQRFAAEAIRAMRPVAQPAIAGDEALPASVVTLSPARRLTKVALDRSPGLIGLRLGATLFHHWREDRRTRADALHPFEIDAVVEENA